jgi:purine-binding chemotaxis protein CheW
MRENFQASNKAAITKDSKKQFLTMNVAGQLLGIAINTIREVLSSQTITRVPLSPKEVMGSLNLRGRIVTAIDLRVILNLTTDKSNINNTSVVVDHENELYSFVVDSIGEVLEISTSEFVSNPTNLNKNWQDLSLGICPLKDKLLVVSDIKKVLEHI